MGPLLRRVARVDSIENHCFLPHVLSPDSVVIDLGANDGHFSRTISVRYGVRCLGVEANPAVFAQLESNGERVSFFNFAVSGSDQPVKFRVSHHSESSSAINPNVPDKREELTVPGKTLATFVAEQGLDRIELLKVDIEGAEVPMFAHTDDALLRRIAQLSIEFHDDFGYVAPGEVTLIRQRLGNLGFGSIKFSSNNTNWLFFRREMMGRLEQAYVRYLVRNVRGVLRRMGFRELWK